MTCPSCGHLLPPLGDADPVATLAQDVARALGPEYHLEDMIGRGGYAVVFRVHDRRLDRKLAVKALFPEFAAVRSIADRFRREAQTAARLSHPNIVPIYFVGGEGQCPCLVMPLVEGEPLSHRIRREGQLILPVALGIARDVAGALDHAHQAGLVHRDVKPDNILLERVTGRSLLTDFGIAKALAQDSVMTASGVIIGTPHYVSPEQASADRDLDARSDVYSLGVVVYEMLAGLPPFNSATVQGIFTQHLSAPVPPLSARREDVTEALEATLARALAKDPANRYAAAGEFVRALTEAAGARSLRDSGGTVVAVQGTGDASLFRALDPRAAAGRDLESVGDVTGMVEAVQVVEARAREAVARVDGRDLLDALAALASRATDPRPALRAPVREALGRLAADAGVVETLASVWRRGGEQAQAEAEEALARLLPECAMALLQLARRDRSAELILLADRIGALDDAGATSLARDTSAGVVEAFVSALGESLRPAATIEKWLAQAVRHPNPLVRVASLHVAATRGGALADHVGRLALSDGTAAVRVAAIRCLGGSRRREVAGVLAAALERGTPEEQVAAADALGSIPGDDVVPILMKVLERTRMLRKERGPVQVAAVRALARRGGSGARQALDRLAGDHDPIVARIAREAITPPP
ncbi:MAG TPA: protein kinase [Gemmatimonadales bacterium]|nr:protein kinase [Gemmatimonadales bacterium]